MWITFGPTAVPCLVKRADRTLKAWLGNGPLAPIKRAHERHGLNSRTHGTPKLRAVTNCSNRSAHDLRDESNEHQHRFWISDEASAQTACEPRLLTQFRYSLSDTGSSAQPLSTNCFIR